jgi:hypothetical protein
VIASDASFADDIEDRKSSQGCVIKPFGGPIVWKDSKQNTLTTSTTEEEFLEHTAKGNRLFRDVALDLGDPIKLYCDNQQTIRLVVGENERITTKLRHVDIQNMWLRQEFKKGQFSVAYLPTNDMPADGLTKPLPRQRFEQFVRLLGLVDLEQRILEQGYADDDEVDWSDDEENED